MSSSMKTILVIGGTSGIGEAFAKRWHAAGKKVIVTGRRQERLNELAKLGLKGYAMDNTKLEALPSHVETLFKQYPDIDTVWINAGRATMSSISDISSTTDADIIDEVATNITGPMILARHFIPKLLAKKTPANFLFTGSALGFVPNKLFPTYCSTKSYTHHFMVAIRQELQESNVSVVEIVPPFVTSELLAGSEEKLKNAPAMTMEDFTNETFEILDNNKAEDLKEVAAGSAKARVEAWRSGIGAVLANSKMGG